MTLYEAIEEWLKTNPGPEWKFNHYDSSHDGGMSIYCSKCMLWLGAVEIDHVALRDANDLTTGYPFTEFFPVDPDFFKKLAAFNTHPCEFTSQFYSPPSYKLSS